MWTDKWVGRRYVPGEFDCAELVRQVAMEVNGIDIHLPAVRSWRKTEPHGALFSVSASPTRAPREGDVVLMRYMGLRSEFGAHVGIYVDMGGAGWVLHNMESAGVILHPIAGLPARLLKLEGFYTWRH